MALELRAAALEGYLHEESGAMEVAPEVIGDGFSREPSWSDDEGPGLVPSERSYPRLPHARRKLHDELKEPSIAELIRAFKIF